MVVRADGRFARAGVAAVPLHGYARLTEDIALLVDGDPLNLRRLLDVPGDYGEGFARDLAVDDFTDEEDAIRIIEPSEQSQIDLFTRIGGRRATGGPTATGTGSLFGDLSRAGWIVLHPGGDPRGDCD